MNIYFKDRFLKERKGSQSFKTLLIILAVLHEESQLQHNNCMGVFSLFSPFSVV